MKKPNDDFTKGFVRAVATLVRNHGEMGPVARDILVCNCPKHWDDIDDYDRSTLASVGLAPKRRRKPISLTSH